MATILAAPVEAGRPRVRVRVTPANLIEGRGARVEGRVRDLPSSTRIVVQERVAGRWRTVARPPLRAGRFVAFFTPRRSGPGVVRALARTRRTSAKAFAVYTVFRETEATWYGPGFFGQSTACGHRYDETLLGVAHRTLPCGTPVTFFFEGKILTIPVVDRGPYGTADWDLTAESARRLGFVGRQTLGVLIATEQGD